MIVFDTNVISELAKPEPALRVWVWASNLSTSRMAVAATSLAELKFGVFRLPLGRRRDDLHRRISDTLRDVLFLPFDEGAAHHYAEIAASRRAAGRPISTFDAQIAATARAYGASIATRDTSGFEDCGVDLIDPWRA